KQLSFSVLSKSYVSTSSENEPAFIIEDPTAIRYSVFGSNSNIVIVPNSVLLTTLSQGVIGKLSIDALSQAWKTSKPKDRIPPTSDDLSTISVNVKSPELNLYHTIFHSSSIQEELLTELIAASILQPVLLPFKPKGAFWLASQASK